MKTFCPRSVVVLRIALILIVLLAACRPASTDQPAEVAAPADAASTELTPQQKEVWELLRRLVDDEKRATAMVAGMVTPQGSWTVGYGTYGKDDPRVPDGDTIFEIGSFTKIFTSTLLAEAVVRGEADLDDPISDYVPGGVTAPVYDGLPVTLVQLATHSAGFPHDPTTLPPVELPNQYADYTPEQMYDFLSQYELPRPPGERYEYSNYGFQLLGGLLERAAGQTDYETLLVDRITAPLGMESTRVHLTPAMEGRMPIPHNRVLLPTGLFKTEAVPGSGGILSSANDMLKFLAANMGLGPAGLLPALQLAQKSYFFTSAEISSGLGWVIQQIDGRTLYWHNGMTAGFKSYAGFDLKNQVGVVVLSNAAVNIDDLGYHLLDPLVPLQAHTPYVVPPPFPMDTQALAGYPGTYQAEAPQAPWQVFEVTREDDRLFVFTPGLPLLELHPESETRFVLFDTDAYITFTKDAQGQVNAFVVTYLGQDLRYQRVE